MSHYAGTGFEREPFSNSPDPSFLLGTRQHATCLQELEISLRLRRGLNLVTGDIGTGKTTLCRSLLRAFAEDETADVHLLLDPHFATSEEFLRVILASVSGQSPEPGMGLWALKETLKQQLFRLGLVEKRLVVLIIDEGQKISPENLEILREMLNYETNTSKLLQIVIFGQRELEPLVDAMPNLADRINVRRRLAPLSLAETRRMILHRLDVAAGAAQSAVRFSLPATLAIHMASGGSPRKTVRLCHMALLEMLVRGTSRVGLAEVRQAVRNGGSSRAHPRRKAGLAALTAICVGFGALWFSLGASGPVLGPGQGAQVSRQDAAGLAAQEAAAALSADGLTLAPARDLANQDATSLDAASLDVANMDTANQDVSGRAASATAPDTAQAGRVSLLPQRDQGSAVREAVEPLRPSLLQVDAQEPAPVHTALAHAGKMTSAQTLARQASFSPERQ